MNAATEFDTGPLSWVKKEIDLALERAEQALSRYAESAATGQDDPEQIKYCRTHLHQVQGALTIVGLDGIKQLAEALEALLETMEITPSDADGTMVDLIRRGLHSIRNYLDELVAGEANQPLRLFPLYAEIQKTRGIDNVSPSDLFFPDLSIRPPRHNAPTPAMPHEEFQHMLRQERGRFQRGLLTWLRDPRQRNGIADMQEAVGNIEAAQDATPARAFWWVATALLSALAEGALPPEADAKQLCARIDLQIRKLIEGSKNVAERLMRDALYLVATSKSSNRDIELVKRTYRLQALFPAEKTAAPALRETDQQHLREAIAAAEEAWNKFCFGMPQALTSFREYALAIAAFVDRLEHTDFRRLAQALVATANALGDDATRYSEALAMEVATGLLLAQHAQENFPHMGGDFAHQVDLTVARIHGCIAGAPPKADAEIPLLDEVSRKTQERQLIDQVAKEIQSNLGQIEQTLDTFFRDIGTRGDLASLETPFHQIEGALTILRQDAAAAALRTCRQTVEHFAQPDYAPQDGDFERIANELSLLGFFVDAMQAGETDFAAFVRRVRAPAGAGHDETYEEAPEAQDLGDISDMSVEQEVEQHKRETQTLLDAFLEQPDDAGLREELRQNLTALKSDADLVADTALSEQAEAALTALDAGKAAAPQIKETIASLQAPVETLRPSDETLQLSQASSEQIDAELLEIFIEEAREVLATVGEKVETIRQKPDDIDALTTIRRAFHTLKGSGRMVGLKDLGETAWAIEQTLNLWLRQEQEVTFALVSLLEQAKIRFDEWVQHLESRSGSAPDVTRLVEFAETLRRPETDAGDKPVGLTTTAITSFIDQHRAEAEAADRAAEEISVEPIDFAGAPEGGEAVDIAVPAETSPTDAALPFAHAEPEIEVRVPASSAEAEFDAVETIEISMPDAGLPEGEGFDDAFFADEVEDSTATLMPATHEAPAQPDLAEALAMLEAPETPAPAIPEAPVDSAPADSAETAAEKKIAAISYDEIIALATARSAPAVEPTPQPPVPASPAAPVAAAIPPAAPAVTPAEAATPVAASAPSESAVAPTGKPGIPEALLAIFREESRTHLATLYRELAHIEGEGNLPTPHEMYRAAHTLAGISATIGIDALNRLCYALEKALLRRDSAASRGDPETLDIIRQAILEIDAMLASLADRRDIQAPAKLIEALDALYVSPLASPSAHVQEQPSVTGDPFIGSKAPETEVPATPPTPSATAVETVVSPTSVTTATAPHVPASAPPPPQTTTPITTVPTASTATSSIATPRFDMARPTSATLGTDQQTVERPVASPFDASTVSPPAPPLVQSPVAETPILPVAIASLPRRQDEIDEQLLPIFLEEAQDLTQQISEQLRAWHESPASSKPVHLLARLLHTLKGSSRMAGAMNLGEITHAIETRVLDAARTLPATREVIGEIESVFDDVRQIIDRLQHGETLDAQLEVPETTALSPAASDIAAPASTAVTPVPPARPMAKATTREQPAQPQRTTESESRQASLRVRADLIDRLVNDAGELSIARTRIEGEMRSLKESLLDLTESVIRLRRQLRDIEIQAETQMQSRNVMTDALHAGFDPLEFDRFTQFQEITRMMAESVNDVSTVQQNLLRNLDDANAAIQAQSRLNRTLQQDLLSVRMMPAGSLSDRLYRIVRQTAKELGKRVSLEITGSQVELDRSVLEKIAAPLEHMLRNSIAHGIERRETRRTAGKPDIGEISLAFRQEGNEVIVSLADDGAGLNLERIRERAIASGLIGQDEAADEARLAALILLPGFSTADKVSQISGRGVGMDVVKNEITNLGGRIEIASESGKGTQFTLYIPLTLAVTKALLVRVGNRSYAVPSAMIEQVLDLRGDALNRIREAGKVDWHGESYPFSFLPHLLGDSRAQPEESRQYWALLLHSGTRRIAVQVDELQGNHEIVVKNIGPQLARVIGIDGATVLSDGKVVLIINPVALNSRAPVVKHASLAPASTPAVSAVEAPARSPTVMVVDDSLTVRKITGRLLAREGYHVLTAKDGIDALEQLAETTPDVMLVDIEMPRLDGFDLTRHIRADERLKHIPIIMITSRTATKHRNYAFEIGVNHFLGKPYQEDELLALIAGHAKHRQAGTPA